MVSRNAKQGANEILWEYGNTGQLWNGKKEQGPPPQDPRILEKFVLACMKSAGLTV